MPNFLATAACNGARPRRVKTIDNQVSRPALIARLMRERHVPRFLVAPTGFGKTAVALEYAETVFRFDNVFWIDGTSPCFLRDLDKGILASALMASGSEPFLVVLEDVPLLDEKRSDMLSQDIVRFLDSGCEVLLTCAPSCDGFENHRDRVVLTSADLLLNDAEIDELRTPAERERLAAADVPRSARVATLKWGSAREGHRLRTMLDKDIREEASIGLISELFIMLCLGEGALGEINSLMNTDSDDFAFIEKYYSYMGVCEFDGVFSVMDSDFEEIASVFSPFVSSIADYIQKDKSDLLRALADRLLLKGKTERACDLMRLLTPKTTRASWLLQRSESLCDGACLLPAYELFLSLGHDGLKLEPSLAIFQYRCLMLLGDKEQAYGCAQRASRLTPVNPGKKLEALLAMAHCSEGDVRDAVLQNARHVLQTSWGDEESWPFGPSFSKPVMEAMVAVASPESHDLVSKSHYLASLIMEGVPHKIIVSLMALLLEDAKMYWMGEGEEALPSRIDASLLWVGSTLHECLHSETDDKLTLQEAAAVAAYEQLNIRVLHQELPWGSDTSEEALALMESLYAQQSQWHHRLAKSTPAQKHVLKALPTVHDGAGPGSPLHHAPEKLTVKLFGGLEVYRGETRIDPLLFSRKNVRILLALLVLNRGREFSRDYLIGQLWPNAEIDAGRRSFYTVWSLLKHALGPTSRECPYLIRQQLGVRLDATLLESDVGELETICHRLLFEGPEYAGWASIHERVTTTFAEDLMPGVEASPIIESWRKEYRSRLTDALTSASNRLRAAGNVQDALWFSQAAYLRESAREDVCLALMRAQIEAGQRSAAIATYHACRRSLADELGIDPSLETMNLYTQIIESEEYLL